MENPILFQAFNLDGWPFDGNTGTLYIFSNSQWTDQNGVARLANPALDISGPCQKVPIEVDEFGLPTVQPFLYQPTVLSIDNPNVRRTGVIYDANNNENYTLFTGWQFPQLPDPMDYKEFVRYNSTPLRPRMQDRYYTADQIQLIVHSRMVRDRGLAAMANGVALVPTTLLGAESMIKAWSQSDGVSGALRVPLELVNVGQDFTVISNNGGDEGVIAWEVTEPIPPGVLLI